MVRIPKIILSLYLTINCAIAADALLPEMELTQTAGGVQVHLNFEHINQNEWREMLEDPELFTKSGYGISGSPGEPALPMTTEMIRIDWADGVSLGPIQRQDEILPEIRLRTVLPGHLDSDLEPVTHRLYENGGYISKQAISLGDPVSMGENQYLPLNIFPLIYDDISGSISAPQKIEFEVHGVGLADHQVPPDHLSVRSIVNPDEQFPRRGHYLIITRPGFEPYLEILTAWKERMGYEVTVATTTVTGTSNTSIKNYIQTAWDTWDSRPDYLLLIGDSDQGMPGFYIQNEYGDYLIGDHPYTLLEGDDAFPELMVGRLSVDTYSELITFTYKIARYESAPPMTDPAWLERALMISTTLGAASAQATKEWVADKLIEKGFDQVHTAYAPEVNTVSAISNPINQGVGFVNYRGFGYYSGWAGPDFTSWDVGNTINNSGKTPIITSVVCGGGNFDAPDDPCFGEVWTRLGSASVPRGAVAFFAPSELYTHTQFNNVIDIGIYSAIFDDGVQTLGEALWAGKYELWRNYHNNTYFPFEQTPEFYMHVYNLLGDPGMQMWTGIPQSIDVMHADTLTSTQNFIEIGVVDESGFAIQGAYVALLDENNAIGNYTDEYGQVSLPVDLTNSDEVKLTVTGKNLLPYLATLPVNSVSSGLSLESWTFDLDAIPVAGETVPMQLQLFNHGEALSNLVLTMSTDNSDISVIDEVSIESAPANSMLMPIIVNLTAASDIEHGSTSVIDLEVTDGIETWNWEKHIVVQAPKVSIQDFILLSGDVTAGDSAQFVIEMVNQGGAASESITITPLDHELLTFSNTPLVCPGLGIEETGQTGNTLDVVFSNQIFPGERLIVQFQCSTPDRIDTLEVVATIGDVIRFGPSQADDYGYRMFDEFDLSFSKAQSYEWLEIDPGLGGSGTLIGITDNWEEADASAVIPLPFPVSYYGDSFTNITVCTNGWAAFGIHDVVNFHNRIIPSPIGPPGMLAPFWDELATGQGRICHFTSGDEGQFVIEWSNVNHLYVDDRLSFELIIFNTDHYPTASGNSDIKFQYNLIEDTDVVANFATIGIESPDSRTGLQATYNNIHDPSMAYLRNNTAILFSTDRGTRYHNASVSLNTTELHFQQNPWSTGTDSIVITNTGETPVAFAVSHVDQTMRTMPTFESYRDPSITKATPDPPPRSGGLREGNDAFGHYWSTSAEVGGPTYTWYDIETPGNLLEWSGDPDDSSLGPISIGFEFPFYNEIYEEMFLGSNGTISFESTFSPWFNSVLPDQMSPPALIAAWWDDLNNDEGPNGSIYYWTNENDQCIITWKDFPKWGTSRLYTFQVILHKIGMIVFQYENMDRLTNSATVGMQNSDRNIGLTIYHNDITPPLSEMAISILRPVEWFSASNWSGRVDPGESESFIIDVSAIGLPQGHYEMPLTIETSAPNYPLDNVLISMDIAPGELPWGDINADYQITLNDAINLIDFVVALEDMTEEQQVRFDLSGDSVVDILDVLILLEAILSTP